MNESTQAEAAPNSGRIGSLLENARRKLLEIGTRNRLIHVNRTNQRANCLNIVNERSDHVFAVLRNGGRKMKFKATGRDRNAEDDDTHLESLEHSSTEFDQGRYTDGNLETLLGPDAQQKRLLRLALDARTAEEEQGVNILYLAMGFLTWFEDKSSAVQREAPLVLLPVELVRNERSSTYDIRCRDDDITTNLPLQERLMQDFGIALPEIDEGEGWSPSDYFAQVSDVVSERKGWRVELDAIQLGFFSFAKLLMLRDLDPENWPEGELTDNELLRGLLVEGFTPDPPLFDPEDRLDELLDPAEIIQVVDADASQTKVIEEVRRGSNLVVQGPPGTGKSQTITNIIAAAVHDGKTVLFMAEKMAALSVVHRRLVKTGLRDVCIELHSRSANKKALAQELGRTLAAGMQAQAAPAEPANLRHARDELNRIAELLHDPLEGKDYSPFEAIAEIVSFIGRDIPAPSVVLESLETLTNADRRRLSADITRYIEAIDRYGTPEKHPFAGTNALDLQPPDVQRLARELENAISALETVAACASDPLEAQGFASPESLDQVAAWQGLLKAIAHAPAGTPDYVSELFDRANDKRLIESLQAAVDWKAAKSSAEPVFNDSAWTASVYHLRPAFARGEASFFARLGGKYRRAAGELRALLRGDLPRRASERLALTDKLLDVQRKRDLLADDEAWLQGVLGDHWRGERTDFEHAQTVAHWLGEVRAGGVVQTPEVLSRALDAFEDPAGFGRQDCRLGAAGLRCRGAAPGTLVV
jgi:hypothetical protein